MSTDAGVVQFSRYWLSLPENLRGILWLVVGRMTKMIASLKDEPGALDGASAVAEERVASIGRVFRK